MICHPFSTIETNGEPGPVGTGFAVHKVTIVPRGELESYRPFI